jgi:hypothetical protein
LRAVDWRPIGASESASPGGSATVDRGGTLFYIMVWFAGVVISWPMAHFVFRCPATSLNVQHQLDGDPDISENEYEGIVCPDCTRLHFINQKTGKLLGEAKK